MKRAARCGGGPKVTDNSIDAHNTTAPSRPQAPPKNRRFRRAVERVHRLGPRVVGELLLEAGADLHRVEKFAGLDRFPREFLTGIGADRWPVAIFAVGSS